MLGCRPEIAIDGPRRVMAILFCDMSGNGSHQEPKLLRDRVIVSRRWMSGLLIGSLCRASPDRTSCKSWRAMTCR